MSSSFAHLEVLTAYPHPNDRTYQYLKKERYTPSPDPFCVDYEMHKIKDEVNEEDLVSPYPGCGEPFDVRFLPAHSSSTLTTLEPYRPDSGSPLIFSRIPLTYNGHLMTANDMSLSQLQDGGVECMRRSSPHESADSNNFPDGNSSVFGLKTEPDALSYHVTDGSSASSSPASSSWIPSQNVNVHGLTCNGSEAATNGTSPILEMVSRECVKCGTVSSGMWWPDNMGHFLCANCSRLRHAEANFTENVPKPRPQKRTIIKKTNQVCTNCKTTYTSLWRRNPAGETVCNACGLYFKLHRSSRPITMRKDSIQKRKRKPKGKEGSKGRLTPPVTPKLIDTGLHAMELSHQVTPSPPSYNLPHIVTNRNVIMDQNHMASYTTLPHVHSPEGFRSSLVRYGSPAPLSPTGSGAAMSSHSTPSPMMSNGSLAYSSASSSPELPPSYSSAMSSYVSPNLTSLVSSPSPSPTLASLLSSSHAFHSMAETTQSNYVPSSSEPSPTQSSYSSQEL